MMRKVEDIYTHLRELGKEIAEKMKEIDLNAGEFAIARPFEEYVQRLKGYYSSESKNV